ncbi:hypothetical protein Ndes2437B_g04506 [Nannochloris sp. 'desiccata']
MFPCLRLTFTSNAVGNLPQHRSFARKALKMPHATRRGSTTIVPLLEGQIADQNTPVIDGSGMEFLCTLGIDSATAATLLGKANIPLDAAHLEALCFVLHTVVQIPVAKLPELFLNADGEFLTLSSAVVVANYKAICGAWPNERQLRYSVISYPAILTSSFPKQLQRCLTSLRDMGFSTAQTAAAVVRCPELTKLHRYEITSALSQCGIIISKVEDYETFEMLSKNPKFLTPNGSKSLNLILEAVKKATGLTSQQAQHIVARCPNTIFQQEKKHFKEIANLLTEFGLTQAQIGQAALLWPSLLSRKIEKYQKALEILSNYKVTPTQVAAYPQVFTHDTGRVVAPRLAFLKKTAPEKVAVLSLASFFSCSDEVFSAQFSKNETKTYLKYKVKAFVKYQMVMNNAAAVATEDSTKLGEVFSDFSDDEEESSVGAHRGNANIKVVVSKASTDLKKIVGHKSLPQQKQEKDSRKIPPLVVSKQPSSLSTEGTQKQVTAEEKNGSNHENRKRQQHQQPQRRFIKRPNNAPKQKNNGQQQQQQKLQRLTPEQIEKSKEKMKINKTDR